MISFYKYVMIEIKSVFGLLKMIQLFSQYCTIGILLTSHEIHSELPRFLLQAEKISRLAFDARQTSQLIPKRNS